MTPIWIDEGTSWKLLSPAGFPKEKELHHLVATAPHLLPLAGSPQLVVLGNEVPLGSGYADVLAVETTGRPVIVEVKLAVNAEARRAVIAQILAYAAFLHGRELADLEETVLKAPLGKLGHATIAGAVGAADQQGSFDEGAFTASLTDHLREGSFRLVLVLDEAPSELVRLVGYLQTITTNKIAVDLVTVASYDVAGKRVVVPQRVEPERLPAAQPDSGAAVAKKAQGQFTEGAGVFLDSLEAVAEPHRHTLREAAAWAEGLAKAGLARLGSYHSANDRFTLLPRLLVEDVGLVTVWNDKGTANPAYIRVWRSVFERRAPRSLARIEELIRPVKLGRQSAVVREISAELLAALSDAYREAAQVSVTPSSGSP